LIPERFRDEPLQVPSPSARGPDKILLIARRFSIGLGHDFAQLVNRDNPPNQPPSHR
jgi:hypothetical protein